MDHGHIIDVTHICLTILMDLYKKFSFVHD